MTGATGNPAGTTTGVPENQRIATTQSSGSGAFDFGVDSERICSHFVLMHSEPEHDGQIHTLGLLERLRDDLRQYGCVKDEFYFRIDKVLRELANPNLHDVNLASAFKIELWDRYGRDNLRMVIAASSSISVAHAAFDAAERQFAGERLTLRKGIMVIRDSGPK